MTSFYSEKELAQLGLASYGRAVLISRNAKIYNPEKLSVGDNVRIDDFCILAGKIKLGSNIHISAYCALHGSLGIEVMSYSGLSARTTIYSAMDDFSGEYLIGPIHDSAKTHVVGGPVVIEQFVQVGAGSVVFPNLTIGEGSVVGALSLVRQSIDAWGIYSGIPVRYMRERKKDLLKFV